MRLSTSILLTGAAVWGLAGIAQAADQVGARVKVDKESMRVTLTWPDGVRQTPAVSAQVVGGVAVVRFAEPVQMDIAPLSNTAPTWMGLVRLDPDGRTLRLALRKPADISVSNSRNLVAIDLFDDGADAPAPIVSPKVIAEEQARVAARTAAEEALQRKLDTPVSTQMELHVGSLDGLTRIAFRGVDRIGASARREGDVLTIAFDRPADVDLAEMRAFPPSQVRGVSRSPRPGAPLSLMFDLEPGTGHRLWREENTWTLDLRPPVQAATQAAPAQPAFKPGASPVPKGGVVKVAAETSAMGTFVTFPFAAPARAAVFRRGDTVWAVFEAAARLDTAGVPVGGASPISVGKPIRQGPLTAYRMDVKPNTFVSARLDGAVWKVGITKSALRDQPAPLKINRTAGSDGGIAAIALARTGAIHWLEDADIGDRLAIAVVDGPQTGMILRQSFPEAALMQSVQGAAIEPRAERLTVEMADTTLRFYSVPRDLPSRRASGPGYLDFARWRKGPLSDFASSRRYLEHDAANEMAATVGSVQARLALARFLIANDLAHEGLGALNMARDSRPALESDPAFRALRGAANAMIGRWDAAKKDLSLASLQNDATAALWRGTSAVEERDWVIALRELDFGMTALAQAEPRDQARFRLAHARAALAAGKLDVADEDASLALATRETDYHPEAKFILAMVAAGRGQRDAAISQLLELNGGRDENVAVRAELEAIKLQSDAALISDKEAVDRLEALRFRWRGDALEIETNLELGRAYQKAGRPRDALRVMQATSVRFAKNPASRALRTEMVNQFVSLFLDGQADKLEPIQALGLFFDYKDLTPVGPDGDRMTRALAGRLIDVDLLEQATTLLQHQVDRRLEGPGKAQTAVDLAAVYMMDRKPEKALQVLAATRVAGIPPALMLDRRRLQAAALAATGRPDAAMEFLERDQSLEAERLRVDILWSSKQWPMVAARLEKTLSARGGEPLDDAARMDVLRAAIARGLADDPAALKRLRAQYSAGMAGSQWEEAFRLLTGGLDPSSPSLADVAAAAADAAGADAFLNRLRQGFKPNAEPVDPGKAPSAPAGPGRPAAAPATNPSGTKPAAPAAAKAASAPAGAKQG